MQKSSSVGGSSQLFRLASYSEEMNPSKRNTMEDSHRIVAPFDNDENMAFFAVYDGHGGRGVVDFIETRLEENIATELREPDDASINARIERAYLTTDIESRAGNPCTSGATAVTCLLRRAPAASPGPEEGGGSCGGGDAGSGGSSGCGGCSGVTVYAANVGDSRAVLCRSGKAERLTYDHKANDESEKLRIEGQGGFVLRNRVLGILAVSRSFGDHGMKDFVVSLPHTTETPLETYGGDSSRGGADAGSSGANAGSGSGSGGGRGSAPECPFLILACDGIWDVMSDQEAVHLVEKASAAGSAEEAKVAEALVAEAMRRGSTDNMTAIVVFF